MNNYILSYNPFMPSPTAGQLDNHIKYNRLVSGHYHPFAGTYLLKSPQSAFVLNESFKGFFDGQPYTLVLFTPAHAGGHLPPDIWTWVNYGLTDSSLSGLGTAESLTEALARLGTGLK